MKMKIIATTILATEENPCHHLSAAECIQIIVGWFLPAFFHQLFLFMFLWHRTHLVG